MTHTVITVDGSIGAGKTTVMRCLEDLLANEPGADPRWPRRLDLEPVDVWEPYLAAAYRSSEDPWHWFRLQMRVIRDRMWPPTHCWAERSLYFQRRAFVLPAVEDGRIAPRELPIIEDLYELADEHWQPRAFVYLRSEPGGCHRRMQARGRASEATVPLAYLEKLHARHEEALAALQAKRPDAPILVVDVEGKTPEQIAREVLAGLSQRLQWHWPTNTD